MGRTERRSQQRKEKKIDSKKAEACRWVATLNKEKQKLIELYAHMLADGIIAKTKDDFIEDVSLYFWATMFDVCEDVTMEDAAKIREKFPEIKREDEEKGKKLIELYGGNVEMVNKKVSEMALVVEARCKELVIEGTKQKEAIEILLVEFNKLSRAMLVNAYKKVKSDVAKNKVNEAIKEGKKNNDIVKKIRNGEVEVEDAVEYIFGDESDKDYLPAKEIAVEELDQEIENKKEVEKPGAKFEFEVLKEVRILDLKGTYATYHIEKNVVVVDDKLSFSCESEVKDWASEERAELLRQLEELKNEEAELLKVFERFV